MEKIKVQAMLTSAYKDKEYSFDNKVTGEKVAGKSTGAYFIVAGKQVKLKLSNDQVEELLTLKNQEGTLELELTAYKEQLVMRYAGFYWN